MLNNTMKSLKTKKSLKKGFTLMEMLIVVAIIAILVAIAIPTFTSSLNKAKLAADKANVRAAYAEASADYLDDNKLDAKWSTGVVEGGVTVKATADNNGMITVTPVSGLQFSGKDAVASYNGTFTYTNQ